VSATQTAAKLGRLELDANGKPLINPALLEHGRRRRQTIESRVADRITAFSGSMTFVYLHILWFASWIGFGVEPYPYGLLTMIVARGDFLSTFVMISQKPRGREARGAREPAVGRRCRTRTRRTSSCCSSRTRFSS